MMAAFLSFSYNSIEQLLPHQDINNRQILLLMVLKRPTAFQIHWTTHPRIACEELMFKMQMMRWRCKIKDIGTGRFVLFFFFFFGVGSFHSICQNSHSSFRLVLLLLPNYTSILCIYLLQTLTYVISTGFLIWELMQIHITTSEDNNAVYAQK